MEINFVAMFHIGVWHPSWISGSKWYKTLKVMSESKSSWLF